MTTRQRAEAIADSLGSLHGWPRTSADDLLAGLAAELGHPDVLDRFQPYAEARAHAVPLSPILHVFGDETPASGLASLVRSLVLGAECLVSAPSSPLLSKFLSSLPNQLRDIINHDQTLPDEWLRAAAGIIAFGSESDLATLARTRRSRQKFQPHSQGYSFAIVAAGADNGSTGLLAADIAASMAVGETFLHNIFLAGDDSTPAAFAGQLARALERQSIGSPPDVPASVNDLRASYSFRARTDRSIAVHGTDPPRPFTVIAETSPLFATAPAPGVVFVKPLPADLGAALRFVSPNIDTVAVHPLDDNLVAAALATGANRVRPLGNAHHLTQPHPHGLPAYAPWVRWIDLG